MDSILLVIIGVALGFFISGVIDKYKRLVAIRELDQTIDRTLKTLKDKIIPARIEEENGNLFLYNDKTNEFLGQGKNFEELENLIKEKYPNKIFNVPQAEIDKHFKD
jgi:hypothetical protein